MKSPPSPTTSTEPPTRIHKEINAAQADVVVDGATKAAATAQKAHGQSGSNSQSGREEVLYERIPSWWIKWVWVIIGMDIIWSGNFAEFIWNRWTHQIAPTKEVKQESSNPPKNETEWVPRPMWQRAGLTLLVLAGGTGIAAALLLAQARTITRIIRLPEAGKIRVETARNWPGRGRIVDSADITARKGRDETELIVTLPNSRGEFLVGLDRATVRGTSGEIAQVRQAFSQTFSWKGIRRDANVIPPGLGRWKSGPAA